MCRFGQEGGAPIGREVSVADGPDAPDWQEANEYLLKMLGPEVYATLRFSRRQLSMHDAAHCQEMGAGRRAESRRMKMDIIQRVEAFRKSWIGVVILLPLRAPGALFHFILDEWTRREQERAWRKHGLPMMPSLPEGESFLPDPRCHH